MEFSLLGAALLGVGASYAVLWLAARRGDAADGTRDVWETVLAAGAGGLVAGRLAAMILTGTNPLTNPADIMIVRGGVDTVWASIGALGVFALLARREVLPLADAAAAAVLAGLAGWQAGCVMRDACLGTPSDLPWAYALDGSTVTRHPVELYAAALLAAGALGSAAWRRRPPPAGVLGAAALAIAAAARLVTEPLRPALGSSPVPWYAVGAAAGVVGATALWRRRVALKNAGPGDR